MVSPFSTESMEAFLINSSMVGLGLIIAIYSLAIPRIKDILTRQGKKLIKLYKERDITLEKLNKDKDNIDLSEKYSEIQKDIQDTKKLPYHLDLGYQLSGSCFVLSLLFPVLKSLIPDVKFISILSDNSIYFFVIGVLAFFVVWFMLFIEFRTYTTEEFDKIIQELNPKDGEDKK